MALPFWQKVMLMCSELSVQNVYVAKLLQVVQFCLPLLETEAHSTPPDKRHDEISDNISFRFVSYGGVA